eukprot:366209-Chlamydomonas_euryale.AAC.18
MERFHVCTHECMYAPCMNACNVRTWSSCTTARMYLLRGHPLYMPCRPSLRAASSRAAVLCRMEVMSRPGFLSRRGLSNWLRVAPVTACCRLGPQRLGPVWSPVVARRSLEVDGFEASISRRPPSRDVRRSCECISRSSSSCRLPVSGEE